MIDEAKAKGLHRSKSGNEQLWSDLAWALCMVPGGDDLFVRFSEGDDEFDEKDCRKKLDAKRRALARQPEKETGIAGFFSLLMAKGIANPAAGRKNDFPQESIEDMFADLTLNESDTNAMMAAEYWWPNLIVKGHVSAFPAPANGGKTAVFGHLAPQIAAKGARLFYINVDSPPDALKLQEAEARRSGYHLVSPDSKAGKSISNAVSVLKRLGDTSEDLSNVVIIVDTLKKFVSVLSKDSASDFYKLMRKLSTKGATVCLLSHTNKYRDEDGLLIFEGTADHRSDIDNMIYFESAKDEVTGVLEITTRPDKVRALFEPISFRIHTKGQRRVEQCDVALKLGNEDDREVLKIAQEVLNNLTMGMTNAVRDIHQVSTLTKQRVQNALVRLAADGGPLRIFKREGRGGGFQITIRD